MNAARNYMGDSQIVLPLERDRDDCVVVEVPWWRSICHLSVNFAWGAMQELHTVRMVAEHHEMIDKQTLIEQCPSFVPCWVWSEIGDKSDFNVLLWNSTTTSRSNFIRRFKEIVQEHDPSVVVIVGPRVQFSEQFFVGEGFHLGRTISAMGDARAVWLLEQQRASVTDVEMTGDELTATIQDELQETYAIQRIQGATECSGFDPRGSDYSSD